MSKHVRLDRLLANLGYGSRREIDLLAGAGRIRLDGARLECGAEKLALDPDLSRRLTVDGAPIDPLPGLSLALNKPLGVTCSHKDAGALVYDLLPQRWRRREPPISTVGRLDKETSGLLLLTDDGALLHRIIAPRSAIPKRYRVQLDRPLRGDEQSLFAAGGLLLQGEDTPLLPAGLEPVSEREAIVTITEGRYHQVRRMFAAVGNHVLGLHRERVGGLDLGDLASGNYRILDDGDVARIFSARGEIHPLPADAVDEHEIPVTDRRRPDG